MSNHKVGTKGGYDWHRRRGEEACAECRKAAAEYMRKYRQRNPEYAAETAANALAYSRAQARLARIHQAEFRRLYDEERAK